MDQLEKEIHPPIWADRFFEWYCNPDMREEIQGDMYEQFLENIQLRSLRYANWWYWINVLLFINKRTLSRKKHYSTRLNSFDMFKNYFKIGYRNIHKNKLTTLINAFGMALAIGCALTVFQFIDIMYHLDTFHENLEKIYVVQREVDFNGNITLWGNTPEPIGPALANDFPQIEQVVRVSFRNGVVRKGENIFNEFVSFVDPAYYDMFDFPVKWGNPAAFKSREGVVIAETIAEKYFGSRNPIGEEMDFRFNIDGVEQLKTLTVKGVLAKPPANISFHHQIQIPFDQLLSFFDKKEDWTRMTGITFLQLGNPEDIQTIKASEDKYLNLINEKNEDWELAGLHFQLLKTAPQTGYQVQYNTFHTARPVGLYMLSFIAGALLILVCFNYINISLASASTRLKEISVRKVLGSERKQIIIQFLSESLLICLLSLLIGIGLAHYFFLPWFENIAQLDLPLDFLANMRIWGFTFILLIIIAIGGAGYPAFYISKFQPVAILKNQIKLSTKSFFRKFLIGTQLFLTLITLFATFVFIMASQELKKKDWGYNQNDLLVVQLENGADFASFKNEIVTNPNILEIAGSREHIGRVRRQIDLKIDETEFSSQGLTVGADYLSTLEIPLIDGRNFRANQETDQTQSLLVNETFRKKMGWEQATGKIVEIDNQPVTVIGEIRDVYHRDFFEEIQPIALQLGSEEAFRFVTVRTIPGATETIAQELESTWKEFYPNAPFNYFFQDSVFDNYFSGFTQVNSILFAASFMTILICIIGLFGLAMLLLTRKMKELSIRKVLGASSFNISMIINKEFLFPLGFAIIIGLPVSFLLMRLILSQISPEYVIGLLPFIFTVGSVLLMIGISVSKHIYTATASSPAKFLKDE